MTDELPEGWAWVSVADLTDKVPNTKPEESPNKEFGYVDISSIDNLRFAVTEIKHFKGKDAPSRARRPIRPNDVLFSNVRTYLRNIALIEPECSADICSTGFTILRPNAAVEPRFLFRYVLTDAFIDTVTPQQTGTHYPATSDRVVLSERIPLAPKAEQQRITAGLEKLLTEVERCKERMAKIPVLLKHFRQSVLAAACSGRLTADWRETHNPATDIDSILEVIFRRRASSAKTAREKQALIELFQETEEEDSDTLPEQWKYVYLKKLCDSFNYGTSSKSRPTGTVPVLRMGNIQDGKFDWKELVYTSDLGEIQKYSLHGKTVLFNRTNSPELVGKTAIYRDERPAIFAGYLIRINPLPELDPEYLNLCLNTNFAREFCQRVKTDGVSQSNINAQKLGCFEVPFCSLQEQQEIVERAGKLLALADRIEERYQAAKKQVDGLTQSILAKAFRGELVPTEAELAEQEGRSYESAEQLLERIQSARSGVETTPKKGKLSRQRIPKRRGEPEYSHAAV